MYVILYFDQRGDYHVRALRHDHDHHDPEADLQMHLRDMQASGCTVSIVLWREV